MNLYQAIEPAQLDWQDNVVYSKRFDDIYHSRAGGWAQAQHVFLSGCQLEQRWSEIEQQNTANPQPFVVLELGFGLGINFLTTFNAWANQPRLLDSQTRLHYIGFEKHPLNADDLAKALQTFSAQRQPIDLLLSRWPALTPGMHRLLFEEQRVVLDLWFGDAFSLLPHWQGLADAVYVDGFSPQKNPDLWTDSLLQLLAQRMSHKSLLATYSVAANVRLGLESAGLVVDKQPGFANKRYMLVARHGIEMAPRLHNPVPGIVQTNQQINQHTKVLVVGAGMAGVWVSNALARAGCAVDLFDTSNTIAAHASGNPAGAFHPHLSMDDNRLSQLSRQGCEATLHSLKRLTHQGLLKQGIDWDLLGHLQLADSVDDEARCQHLVEHLQFPIGFLRWLSNTDVAAQCGVRSRHGGLWFAQAGWLNPRRWLEAALQEVASQAIASKALAGRVQLRLGKKAIKVCSRLGATATTGLICKDGEFIPADYVVIASAEQSISLLGLPSTLTAVVKGQVSVLKSNGRLPRCVVSGSCYGIPLPNEQFLIGATYERPALDVLVSEAAHQHNIGRWNNAFPDAQVDDILFGRSAFRSVWPDRLPAVGHAMNSAGQCLPDILFATGYASRGITWAALAGDVIAAQIANLPQPLPSHLLASIDPMRFAARWALG